MFDTGPQFVFNMGGGPGVRVHQFGGGRPRRRPGTAQPPGQESAPSITSALSSLLPLLFLFILPLLSSLFSGDSTSKGPSVVFNGPKTPWTQARVSSGLKVPYFVNPVEVEDYSTKQWKNLDKVAETKYVHQVNGLCEYELRQREQMKQDAQGWFFVDEVKYAQARKMPMPNCKRLRELGYHVDM